MKKILIPLMLGALSTPSLADPVSCYESSNGLHLTASGRVALCSGAENLEPISCFQTAPRTVAASIKSKVHVCMGTKSKQETEERFSCLLNAKSLPLNATARIKLCNQSYMEAIHYK